MTNNIAFSSITSDIQIYSRIEKKSRLRRFLDLFSKKQDIADLPFVWLPAFENENESTFNDMLFNLINIERHERGLKTVTRSTELNDVAASHSFRMSNSGSLQHDSFSERKFNFKGKNIAEIIIANSCSAGFVVSTIMKSDEIRMIVLDATLKYVGISTKTEVINGINYSTLFFTTI